MKIKIVQIEHLTKEYEDEVVLRDKVLRKPLGLAYTKEQLLEEKDEIHFVAYDEEKIVGCLLLKILPNNILKMRQVAIDFDYQSKGIGKLLVEHSEKFALLNGFTEIEMHARDTAVPFYLKLGYEIVSEKFMEVTIPHFKMKKKIK
ncbi:MAG: GNAT family N-acetyltransferase [Chlorobiaceae bacterium]|nr:GNAT family N-acetyltransferase [Chlorobiaceae bacterium]MBA4309819.1 GNAT family N-acetyltransferase [Chlorobiaceae bacterium]